MFLALYKKLQNRNRILPTPPDSMNSVSQVLNFGTGTEKSSKLMILLNYIDY